MTRTESGSGRSIAARRYPELADEDAGHMALVGEAALYSGLDARAVAQGRHAVLFLLRVRSRAGVGTGSRPTVRPTRPETRMSPEQNPGARSLSQPGARAPWTRGL